MTRCRFVSRASRGTFTAMVVVAVVALGISTAAAQTTAKPQAARPTTEITLVKPVPTAVKSGDNQFEVMVKGADGKPLENADVSIIFVMPPMGAMAEMRNEVKLKPSGGGKYAGSGNVMMAGRWNVTISVRQNGKQIGQKKIVVTAK
jgi:hypothetical protein